MKTTNFPLIHQQSHNLKQTGRRRKKEWKDNAWAAAVEKKRQHVVLVPILFFPSTKVLRRTLPALLCLYNWKCNASDYIDLGMGGRGGGGRFGPGKEMISRDGAGGRRRREVPGKLWKEAGAPLRYISKLKLSTDELRSYSWAEFEINLVFNQTKEAEPNWPRLVTFSLQSRI